MVASQFQKGIPGLPTSIRNEYQGCQPVSGIIPRLLASFRNEYQGFQPVSGMNTRVASHFHI